MPDSFEHTPSMTMRMPNGALASIAGNIDDHHQVAIADLVLVQRTVPQTVTQLIRERQPDVVGLSVMTFQRHTTSPRVSCCARWSRAPSCRASTGFHSGAAMSSCGRPVGT